MDSAPLENITMTHVLSKIDAPFTCQGVSLPF